jgi:gluconokinase
MVIVVFGVSGVGKTTVGRLLADELRWKFHDADDFHSEENIEKMRHGIPLADRDRQPWLERINALIRHCVERNESAVIACSALKVKYRKPWISQPEIKLVYLEGNYDLIERRLKERRGHFMNPQLLQSQFDALEAPECGALVADAADPPKKIVDVIRRGLQL